MSREEWLTFRKLILERDSSRCLHCQNESYLINFEGSLATVIKGSSEGKVTVVADASVLSINLHNSFIKGGKYYCYFVREENSDRAFIQAIRCRTEREDKLEELDLQNRLLSGVFKFEELGIEILLSRSEVRAHFVKNKRLSQDDIPQQPSVNEFRWVLVKNLHIHHTYYQYGLYPWQYPSESLQTLCWNCHEKLHANRKVPVHGENGNLIQDKFLTLCYRCYGAGWFPEYTHVENGICFGCRGAKYEELITKNKI